jgi:hypothetical protein
LLIPRRCSRLPRLPFFDRPGRFPFHQVGQPPAPPPLVSSRAGPPPAWVPFLDHASLFTLDDARLRTLLEGTWAPHLAGGSKLRRVAWISQWAECLSSPSASCASASGRRVQGRPGASFRPRLRLRAAQPSAAKLETVARAASDEPDVQVVGVRCGDETGVGCELVAA